ncbi:MAG: DUF91 domain-containing protein [Nitrospinae bacterium]|nr:DUF91 domain-containing protein [Nitrospinota bacterium]
MKKYKTVKVSEKELEDLIRQGSDLIEEGLIYIDHQRMTDRGPLDILFVDSAKALVVAELKVVEDDTMLVQGIDYYDYVSTNIEALARVYKKFDIDPRQSVRLFLIASSFSVSLLNRCKWIDIPVSLFTFKCIKFKDSEEIIPIFSEVNIPSIPEPPPVYSIDDRLNYITNPDVKGTVEALLSEIKSWNETRIQIEPTKDDISLKISGRVFSYINPRRKHFMVSTYDNEGKWTGFPINQEEDLEPVRVLLKANIERLG